MRKPLFLLLCGSWLLGSCSSTPKPEDAGDGALNKELDAKDSPDLNYQRKFEKVEVLAFGKDGFPRVKRIKEDKFIRFEVDFNGDGRIDYIQKVHPDGDWIAEESIDIDGDGRMDITNKYEKTLAQKEPQLVSQEIDATMTGSPNVWKSFKDGKLTKREIDLKGNGKANYRELYDQMKLVKVEKDENLDASPDLKAVLAPALHPEGPEPGKKTELKK